VIKIAVPAYLYESKHGKKNSARTIPYSWSIISDTQVDNIGQWCKQN